MSVLPIENLFNTNFKKKLASSSHHRLLSKYCAHLKTFKWTKKWFKKWEDLVIQLSYFPHHHDDLQRGINLIRDQIINTHVEDFNTFLESLNQPLINHHFKWIEQYLHRRTQMSWTYINEKIYNFYCYCSNLIMDLSTILGFRFYQREMIESSLWYIVNNLCRNPQADHLLIKICDSSSALHSLFPYLDWRELSFGSTSKLLLQNHISDIDWHFLSSNPAPAAIEILKEYPENISWHKIIFNPAPEAKKLSKDYIKNASLDPTSSSSVVLSSYPSPEVIEILKKHPDMICGFYLSANPTPEAMELLEKYPHLIDRYGLSANPTPGAMELLKKYPDLIDGYFLSGNTNPEAMELLKKYPHLIDGYRLSANPTPGAMELLKKYPHLIVGLNLSANPIPEAMELLKTYPDLINGYYLSANPASEAMELLKTYPDLISGSSLSGNRNPEAMEILKTYPDLIDWNILSSNPVAIEILKANPDKINWYSLLCCRHVFDVRPISQDDANILGLTEYYFLKTLSNNDYDYKKEKIQAFNKLSIFSRFKIKIN